MNASHIPSSVRSPQRAVVPVVFVQRQVVRMASPGSTSTPTAFLPAPVLKLNDGASSSGVDVPPRTRRTNCADPTRCMWDQALNDADLPDAGWNPPRARSRERARRDEKTLEACREDVGIVGA